MTFWLPALLDPFNQLFLYRTGSYEFTDQRVILFHFIIGNEKPRFFCSSGQAFTPQTHLPSCSHDWCIAPFSLNSVISISTHFPCCNILIGGDRTPPSRLILPLSDLACLPFSLSTICCRALLSWSSKSPAR